MGRQPGARSSGNRGAGQCFRELCLLCSLPQLAFLLLSLTPVGLQLYSLAQEGVRRHWRKPGHWLEVATPVPSREKSRNSEVLAWT